MGDWRPATICSSRSAIPRGPAWSSHGTSPQTRRRCCSRPPACARRRRYTGPDPTAPATRSVDPQLGRDARSSACRSGATSRPGVHDQAQPHGVHRGSRSGRTQVAVQVGDVGVAPRCARHASDDAATVDTGHHALEQRPARRLRGTGGGSSSGRMNREALLPLEALAPDDRRRSTSVVLTRRAAARPQLRPRIVMRESSRLHSLS